MTEENMIRHIGNRDPWNRLRGFPEGEEALDGGLFSINNPVAADAKLHRWDACDIGTQRVWMAEETFHACLAVLAVAER